MLLDELHVNNHLISKKAKAKENFKTEFDKREA